MNNNVNSISTETLISSIIVNNKNISTCETSYDGERDCYVADITFQPSKRKSNEAVIIKVNECFKKLLGEEFSTGIAYRVRGTKDCLKPVEMGYDGKVGLIVVAPIQKTYQKQ